MHEAYTRARNTDPWTSHAAAERIMPTLNERQKLVYAVHRQHKNGLCNWETETILKSHNSNWRTRVSELVAMGLLVNSGRTRQIPDSDDPRAHRIVFICRDYALPVTPTEQPTLFE